MKLCTISDGDTAYRYDKSIVVYFQGKRKVLSTSVFNGGYHENYTTIFNHDGKTGAGMPCEMLAPTYTEHMKLLSRRLGLSPETTTGMGTAADMENCVIKSLSYKELTVTALVTGGIETNGGRAGDPATWYKPLEKPNRPGTINIMLFLDSDLPAGTLTRALVTCTEAKTAAIQELMEGSHYSNGLATGSGTDQTIVVANAESPLYLEGAGKHSKMGELIGRVVKDAVKEALAKQSGLTPEHQHHVLRRLKRFGITADTLWQDYLKDNDHPLLKPLFLEEADILCRDSPMVTWTILLIHSLDEYLWHLLSEEEMRKSAEKILSLLAACYGCEKKERSLEAPSAVNDVLFAWSSLFLEIFTLKTGQ